jgi:ubiquinone/menaquinone biosynthesis C-methylase UbiE
MNTMPAEFVELVCPGCGGDLARYGDSARRCQQCDEQYPIAFGITDLRYPRPLEMHTEHDAALSKSLIDAYGASTFAELLELFLSGRNLSRLSENLVSSRRKYRALQVMRTALLTEMFLSRLSNFLGTPDSTFALDLGCGSGENLLPLARGFSYVIGVDPYFPSLILARKYCEENRLEHVQLVQAYGQHLPFRDNSFAYASAQNVIEHVFDVDRTIAELSRVLAPVGFFAADSRNRFDLVLREPHAKIRWVGLLPRKWAGKYVHWRTGITEYDDHVRLISYWELRRALQAAFGSDYRIVFPHVEAYGMPRWVDTILGWVERLPLVPAVVLSVFPSHLALGRKR